MTPIELGTVIAAYALALARLLNAARFAWAWLPKHVQPVLPALLIALPQLAGALGLVETKMDIAVAALMTMGSVVAAIRGAPAAVAAKSGLSGLIIIVALSSLAAPACSAVKPVVRDVSHAATILCETAYGVDQRAQAAGLSVEDFCRIHDVLAPFIEEATRAQRVAAGRAGLPPAGGQ